MSETNSLIAYAISPKSQIKIYTKIQTWEFKDIEIGKRYHAKLQ